MKTFQLLIAIVSGAIALTSVSAAAQGPSIGNGQKNWIITEGVTRDGGKLTLKEVQIEGDGWLVIHPFEEGAPNGDKYVAATFLTAGKNENVSIDVHKGLTTGEMFIVMLHSDSNGNHPQI